MKASCAALVAHREQVTPLHVLLRLHAPLLVAAARPGQFVHVRVTEACDPLLRRPFSVMRTEAATGLVDVLFQVVGRGTEALGQVVEGQTLDLLGPLGTPFLLPTGGSVVLVAGGVGVAPLVFLAEALAESPTDYGLTGLFGARTESLLCCWLELAARCSEFEAVTEDGSLGRSGLVTEALAERLSTAPHPPTVYACGPLPMLAEVARLCEAAGAPAWVSLERWMGCGVGACLGCVVPARRAGWPRYVRVCHEGPVFAAQDLDWEAMPA